LSGDSPHATIRFEVSAVKNTLLVPIKYLLVYILVAAIMTLGVYVYSWCENPLPLSGGMHDHVDLMFRGLYAVMVPASLVALVILILMLQHGKGIPWLLFLALWFSFSGLLYVQVSILRPYRPLPPRTAAPVEIPQRIHSYQKGAVYIEESFTQGKPAVMMSVSGNPQLSAGRIGKVSEDSVRIGDMSLSRSPKNPFFNEALQTPPIISAIFRDFKVLSSFFAFTHSSSFTRAVLTIASFGFLISSCWIFGRFTSWPLLNTVYLLFVLRIVVLLSALMLSPEAQELFQAFVPEVRLADYAHYIFAAGGLLLVLWDLIFIPFHRFPRKGQTA
jgi:hypothetical protein